MKKNIQIFGCGYIGQLVATLIAEQGCSVTGFVRSKNSQSICLKKNIESELIDFDKNTGDLFIDCQGALVLYLIAPQPRGDADLRVDQFIKSIKTLLPEKIVLLSTTGVYGDCRGKWVNETTPINPQVDRARRRADAEQKITRFCKHNNIALVILRVAGIYGPDKLPLKRISSGEPVVREEDSPYSNRIHASDLVAICCKALLDNEITGIYNCADGKPTTMYDYFVKVAAAYQLSVPPSISIAQAKQQLSKGMMSYMAESRRIDNKKLLKDFSIKLKCPDLASGLAMLNSRNIIVSSTD
jgi:nucleoside-diphosphate-sugar epimerase